MIAGIKIVADPFLARDEVKFVSADAIKPLHRIALDLTEAGHTVEVDRTVPGLFRIDGGPELTAMQFMQVGRELLA